MKRIFFVAFFALISCTQKTKQQRAEELVENYIHIHNHQSVIEKHKFTKLTTFGNSDNYKIGIENTQFYDTSHRKLFIGTLYYVLNNSLTKVENVETE